MIVQNISLNNRNKDGKNKIDDTTNFYTIVYLGMHDLFGMYFTTKTCNNSVILWDIMNYVYNT